MKKICFFTTDMSLSGGTNKCTSMIANALVDLKEKYDVYVIDMHNDGNGSIMYPINEKIHYWNINGSSRKNTVDRLRKFLRQNKIDVIICVEGLLGIYSIPASMFYKTRNIMWEHGNFYLKRYKKVDMVRWLEFKLADYYVTLTKEDMMEFARHFRGRCKIKYIYNACESLGMAGGYDLNSKSIITVGMNREDKGYDMLVDVARIVAEKHPDWTWNVYGNMQYDPELTKVVLDKVREYRLENFLLFHGLKNDMSPYYKEAGIMVMTSRREGLPMVLLEARGFGIPMVAFDIKTGPSEIIDDGKNGYLVEPYDLQHMADRVCDLIEDRERRKRFSENTQIGIDRFSLDRITKEWVTLIDEILSKGIKK